MGNRATVVRILGLALAATAALALAGCSMAGLERLRPQSAAKPVAVAKAVPKPEKPAARDEGLPFVALAFAAEPAPRSSSGGSLDGLISKYADYYDVPESLVHRVVKRESGYNAGARNGPYYGLMQISHATARSMGYKGEPSGLLDAETNLKYSVKYLKGAYIVGGFSQDAAIRNYSRGYYYDAKRKGLLEASGLR